MKTMIYCEPTERGIHSFYLVDNDERYFLFSQKYRKSVQDYYSKGVSVNRSIDFSKSHKDNALKRTMSKLPMYIRYIEKEFGILVLNQTKKKAKECGYLRACA